MAIRSKLSATVSLSACAVALTGLATPAWAQDAEEAADEGDVIIVSGYRASLESAIAEKRDALVVACVCYCAAPNPNVCCFAPA